MRTIDLELELASPHPVRVADIVELTVVAVAEAEASFFAVEMVLVFPPDHLHLLEIVPLPRVPWIDAMTTDGAADGEPAETWWPKGWAFFVGCALGGRQDVKVNGRLPLFMVRFKAISATKLTVASLSTYIGRKRRWGEVRSLDVPEPHYVTGRRGDVSFPIQPFDRSRFTTAAELLAWRKEQAAKAKPDGEVQ